MKKEKQVVKQFINVNILFDKDKIHSMMDNYIKKNEVQYICAINANSITVANNDENFKEAVNGAGFNLCDGSLIALTYKMIYKEKVEPYPGPDFFIHYLSQKKYKSFFFGSTQELLDSLKEKLQVYDPAIKDMPFYSPPFLPLDEYDYEEMGKMINESDADIIWISLGAPKQEVFMQKLKPHLKKGVMVGVGAAFIFYGDETRKRAPEIIRKMHLEWLYRIITTRTFPKRFRNQLLYMPSLLLKEFLKKVKNNES